MIINLCPVRCDSELTVSVEGDAITLNGVTLDFSPLPEGAVLPRRAVECDWVMGNEVTRIDGQINITIMLPYGAETPEEARIMQSITVTEDGEVSLPV